MHTCITQTSLPLCDLEADSVLTGAKYDSCLEANEFWIIPPKRASNYWEIKGNGRI